MVKRFTLKKTAQQRKIRHSSCDQRGSVLLALLITMVILSVLAAALLPTLFTSQMGQVSAGGAMKAYHLAEAGGRYTLPRLGEIADGEHTFKFSGGETFFIINKRSAAEFTSTGVVFEGTDLESRVTITYEMHGIFDYGLFGGGGISIGNNAVVYGDIGTNGDNLDGISGSADVNGDQNVSADKDMTPVELPSAAESWMDITSDLNMSSNNQTVTLNTGQYYTSEITISNNSTVNITGDVVIYVEGTTTASNNSTLSINSGASLTLYAGDNVDLSNNSTSNTDGTPSSFVIYGLAGCETILLSNNSDTHAAIYAPEADITAGNNSDFYGSLVGGTITISNNAYVSYDDSLLDIGGPDYSAVEQYFHNE